MTIVVTNDPSLVPFRQRVEHRPAIPARRDVLAFLTAGRSTVTVAM